MATWVIFDAFKEAVAEGVHDLGSNTLRMALTNVAPSQSADSVFTDITEIAAGNGYVANGVACTVTTSEQTSGTYSLALDDVVFTASGGSIAEFRYLVLYNDSAASDNLICFIDYGAGYTITDGNNFTAVAGAILQNG